MSLGIHDFRSISFLATLFTPEKSLRSAQVLKWLPEDWINLFGSNPTMLPDSSEMPEELPRLSWEGDTGWGCQFAPSRFTILWRAKRTTTLMPHEFVTQATPLLVEFANTFSVKIGRLGVIAHRYLPHESPAGFLAHHFCQQRWLTAPFNRPSSFELSSHKIFELKGFKVNSWVRNKTGMLTVDQSSIIIVEQDLNTLKEHVAEYKGENIQDFVPLAFAEFDKILSLYYPHETDL